MNFTKCYDFGDKHAFLSPSKYHWVNDDEDKLASRFNKWEAAAKGTRLHALAAEHIKLGLKMPKTPTTFNMFVNDAIGYRMTAEQGLFYSDNCFGTADAISFVRNKLRIHDYKSGVTKPSMTQLEVYAAIFCLEYGFNPNDIEIELRIYFDDEIIVHHPEQIAELMIIIVESDKLVDALKQL